MTWRDLFLWWNAIYSVPLLFALLYLGISLALGTLVGDHDVDHDADVDADADLDVDHDVDVDVDHDVDVDMDHDVDVDHDVDADHDVEHEVVAGSAPGHDGGVSLLGVLVFLGVGHAPAALVLQCLLLTWGVLGLSIHALLGGGSAYSLALSVPISLLGSVVLTRALAIAFGRAFRKTRTLALSRNEFVGKTGRVVYPVTAEEGTIHFRDEHGTLHRVRARTEEQRLESGQEIVILGYDPAQNIYMVDDAQQFVRRGG